MAKQHNDPLQGDDAQEYIKKAMAYCASIGQAQADTVMGRTRALRIYEGRVQ